MDGRMKLDRGRFALVQKAGGSARVTTLSPLRVDSGRSAL